MPVQQLPAKLLLLNWGTSPHLLLHTWLGLACLALASAVAVGTSSSLTDAHHPAWTVS